VIAASSVTANQSAAAFTIQVGEGYDECLPTPARKREWARRQQRRRQLQEVQVGIPAVVTVSDSAQRGGRARHAVVDARCLLRAPAHLCRARAGDADSSGLGAASRAHRALCGHRAQRAAGAVVRCSAARGGTSYVYGVSPLSLASDLSVSAEGYTQVLPRVLDAMLSAPANASVLAPRVTTEGLT